MTSSAEDFRFLHLRRSLTSGKAYLILGLVIPMIFIATLYSAGRTMSSSVIEKTYGLPPSVSGGAILVATLVPTLIPLATVIGSFSPLLLFVNDRSRGVHEYLLAYGKKPSDIFLALVVSVIAISAILLAVPLLVAFGLIYATGQILVGQFVEECIVYVLPVGFVTPLFISGISAIWVSLTKRVQFVNSPIGIAPMFGLLPVVVILIISEIERGREALLFTGIASVLLVAATATIFVLASKLLRGERFIV